MFENKIAQSRQKMPEKNKNINRRNAQKLIVTAAAGATIVASGSTSSPTPTAIATASDDVIVLGANGTVGIVDALAGDDKITGGDLADFIRGNAGADVIDGGAGVDNIVVIGTSSNGSYTLSDIQNPNGTGIDLSALINLAAVNDNAVSDVQAGEVIDGGVDGAHLFVYGDVDFSSSTLKNITRIDVQSKITFTATQLKQLIDSGELKALIGDGTSVLEITNDGMAIELNFSAIDMQNIKDIILGPGVTLLLDQDDLRGVQSVGGTGAIKAVSGSLDVNDIAVDAGVAVVDATPTPSASAHSPEFDSSSTVNLSMIENSINVGSVTATDADGDEITYSLSGDDATLFNISANTGAISFKTSPDFENPSIYGFHNIFDVIVTATDATGLFATKNVTITVINENEAPILSSSTHKFIVAENQTAVGTVIAVDVEGDAISYGLSGGDADKFNVSATGEITFKTAPDFEAPSDVGADNIYNFNIMATDVHGKASYQAVEVAVKNISDGAAVMNLSELTGANGYLLNNGAAAAGASVSNAGDVNGDGYDDVIIGAPLGNSLKGSSYIVFGKATDTSVAMVGLNNLDGSDGFRLNGTNKNKRSGTSVSAAGDINGDGYADILIGEPLNTGKTYVVYGKATGFAATMNLNNSTLDGTIGFTLKGSNTAGYSVSSAGDVNGDGIDDIIVGEYGKNASYVLFGQTSGFASNINLSGLNGADGFKINGVTTGDQSGISVSSAGDVNGDGYDDLIIGADRTDANGTESGASYIVFGKGSGYTAEFELSSLDGVNGFKLNGVTAGDQSGLSVSSAGDVNGDGYDDLIIGADRADANGTESGASYIVFGQASGFAANFELNGLNGTNGFKLNGVTADDRSGHSISSAGDFNGDGFDDLIIGANYADPDGNNNAGSSYVIFGKATGFDASIELDSLDGTTGFRLDGAAPNHYNGASVSSAGDVNGDGYDDLIFGTPGTGSAYIVYGGGQYAANDTVATNGDDALIGTTGVDIIDGLAGDDVIRTGFDADTLIGGGGADKLFGGGGADIFKFAAGDSKISISGSGNTGSISGYDIIEDFKVGDGTHNSETLEIAGGANIVTALVKVADGVLTIDGENIESHSITAGVISFDDAATYSTALEISTQGEIAAAVEYLQLQDLGDVGASVAFDVGADTFIFTQGSHDGLNDDLDIIVRLEDVQIDSLVDTLGNGAMDLYLI